MAARGMFLHSGEDGGPWRPGSPNGEACCWPSPEGDRRSLVDPAGSTFEHGGLAMTTLNRLNHLWLPLAYFGVFLIVVLSLVPGTLRPHTGAGGSMEHLAAYTLVATAFGFGLANTRQAFVYGIGLTAVAGLLEELQHFSPGRTPNIEGFLASSSGVGLGFGMCAIVMMVLRCIQAGCL